MSRPLRLPPPTTTLQIYRHLLRESSYLPSVVRPFIDKHIKSRFHRTREEPQHAASRTKKAQRALRYLRAANAGDTPRMTRVLLYAFGRIGPRRRELLEKVIRIKPPSNTEELAAQLQKVKVSPLERPRDWLDNWDTSALQALARSQISASPPNQPGPEITTNMIAVKNAASEKNSWGEEWNPRTYRTKLKKFWINVADRILPPLPKTEWDTLELLSRGLFQEAGWHVPTRRAVAGGTERKYEPEWKWQLYATQPVSIVDQDSSRRFKLLTGAKDENTPTGDPQPLNCHTYTSRVWRRLLLNIWRLSPTIGEKMTDNNKKQVELKWGVSKFMPPKAVTAGEMEFFSGLSDGMAAGARKGR
ncbi:hypothetical protein QBC43DRAFT_332333 [Cladorrhinum sp. PSN259]|nr:hypothetical protein QBC43DRAFT_332333 [Cladorrhinum sp. PSN259]